ncbi:glycosyltransferase [Spiroplasma gladiatoris]|uniref:Glycosyltransferase n=1 Tax=Spiroplasma gladiatoris TaxID=2143 RepID=A0A4P7AHZ9_9MOLU|nr:glycosyltransferase family 2 protein [Spiroplasma gladiatoris]QBQ07318.1 glycosyltransferase [Spiroplasma gladiatoris]
MLISFVLVSKGSLSKVEKAIKNIEQLKDNDYEVIIIADCNIEDSMLDQDLKNEFWLKNNVKIILNSSSQGKSVSWNMAIDLAEGEYIKFVSEKDTIDNNFIASFREVLEKNKDKQIDLVEYLIELKGLGQGIDVENFLENQKAYNLAENFEPFAFLSPTLFNKLFKTSLLQEFGFKFRRFVRFDMLFVYKVLGQAKSFIFMGDKLYGDRYLEEPSYSSFDLVNQGTHIINYYRRIGKYKNLKDHLNYAYFKTLCFVWLQLVKLYNNKLLMKKAIIFAEKKFSEKREEFIQNNSVLKLNRDTKFREICQDFNKYIKDLLKLVK